MARETILHVDAEHKFGKTQIYTNPSPSEGVYYAYKDAELTEQYTAEELMYAVKNGACISMQAGGFDVFVALTGCTVMSLADTTFAAATGTMFAGSSADAFTVYSKEANEASMASLNLEA